MFRILAAASLASLPICNADGHLVDGKTLAFIAASMAADAEGEDNDALSFLGPGSRQWLACAEDEMSRYGPNRAKFTPDAIATAVVDACVIEADNYRRFIAAAIGDPHSPEVDRAFERMRTKMVRYHSAVEVSLRAGYTPAATASEAPNL